MRFKFTLLIWVHVELHLIAGKSYFENRLILEEARAQGFRPRHINPVENMLPGNCEASVAVSRVERPYLNPGILMLEWYNVRGTPVVNGPWQVYVSQNKFLTYIHLAKSGLRVPETFLAYKAEHLEAALDRLAFPVVLKPAVGGKGAGIFKAESRLQALQAGSLYETAGIPFIVQRYLKGLGWDLRVLTVGGEVLGAIKRIPRAGDWRTNISLGGKAENYRLSGEEAEESLKAVEALKLDVAGVDMIWSKDELYILEVNPTPLFRGLMEATGVNPARKIVEYARRIMRK